MSKVAEVKQRVLELAREIENLASAGLPSEEFFDGFLDRLVRAVGARAGAVWMRTESGAVELFCEKKLSETDFDVVPGALEANEQLVRGVMIEGQSRAFTPSTTQVKLPTSDQVIIAPLRAAKTSVGAVEIFQHAHTPAASVSGYLQFIEQMCAHASRYLDRRTQQQSLPAPAASSGRLDQFLLHLHSSLVSGEVAAVSASDGRYVIGCERVGVAIRKGPKTVVTAISGYDTINRRSKLVRNMERLIASVIETRKPLVYTGKIENLSPQIEGPLADYIQESGARMVMVLPLLEPRSPEPDTSGHERKKVRPQRILGGLISEQFSESQPAPAVEENTFRVADHVSTALQNARRHERLLMTPIRKMVGGTRSLWEGRFWLKVFGVLALVGAIGVALAVIPYKYRVEGKGRLMPVVQRSVFAPLDGEVVEVKVASGDRVTKGQQLLQLRNDELHARLLTAKNAYIDSQNRLLGLRAQYDDAVTKADRAAMVRIEGDMVKTTAEIAGAKEQVELFEREEKLLTVLAPIDGVVVTFQLDQLLKNRPVHRGDLMVEVMDDSGPWRLELELDEKRMGHLLRAVEKSNTIALPVEYVLATNVESTYDGKIERIATRADESDSGNIVEIFADIDVNQLPQKQIGAEVITKINCGDRSLGYVLFGDVIEFLQKNLWL